MVSSERPVNRFGTTTPLYIQIAEGLLDRIESGQVSPGDRLPSERELSQMLGVNRMTLRRALELLESQGLLIRRQGDGTYVAEPKIERQATGELPVPREVAQGWPESPLRVARPDVGERLCRWCRSQ